MSTSGAAACGYQDFMINPVSDNFFQYVGQRLDTPVTNRLAADFYDLDIWIKPLLWGNVEFLYKFFTYKASLVL